MRRYEYDEEIDERPFSWTDLFIKVIIVLIFILFTIWLISLPNRKVKNNPTNIATSNVFSENISTMKDVGLDYFTMERLPKEVGEVKTITLEKMYKNKMLLPLTDKNGKACSSKNSYVSMEKKENEYQMKVYLECGKESDYVITTLGCYNYCNNNKYICEKKYGIDAGTDGDSSIKGNVEYQYSKSGGTWGAWSDFSKWVTTSISKNEYTDVETKVERENSGGVHYKLMGRATCPSVSGYSLVSKDGNVCTYQMSANSTNPICPSVSGYTFKGRNGLTCSYSATSSSTANPICPSVSGYSYTGRSGFTCNYSKKVTGSDYTLSYYGTGSGSYIPADTSTYHYVQKSADYVYKCDGSCGMRWYYTYTIYKKNYKTVTYTTTKTAQCPSGYSKSGSTCAKSSTSTTTKTAQCPSGYSKSGSTCVTSATKTTTRSAYCPDGFYSSGSSCISNSVNTTTRYATCPSGQINDRGVCYITETLGNSRDVTYYRYRTREYLSDGIDYKWSFSNNDKDLLAAGYKLTGVTRNLSKGEK